jgi:cell fate regulator YaaT (PSP1 superfamily)
MNKKKFRYESEENPNKVYRKASERDLEKWAEARAREKQTMMQSRDVAQRLGLKMKISDVEFQGDGSKATFYYTADERVDFRQLIRELAQLFSVRIEMKQIGARQEAQRLGGIGSCVP